MALSAQVAQLFLSLAFLGYGVHCLIAQSAKVEFDRYGLPRFRRLTGSLEIAGAFGLGFGFFSLPLLRAASLGLAALMFLGVLTRLRIKDSFGELFPALLFCLLNLYLFFRTL